MYKYIIICQIFWQTAIIVSFEVNHINTKYYDAS